MEIFIYLQTIKGDTRIVYQKMPHGCLIKYSRHGETPRVVIESCACPDIDLGSDKLYARGVDTDLDFVKLRPEGLRALERHIGLFNILDKVNGSILYGGKVLNVSE